MTRSTHRNQEEGAGKQLLPQPETQNKTAEHAPADPAGALQRTRGTLNGQARPADILTLQRSVGNRAVQRLLLGTAGSGSVGTIQRHMPDRTHTEAMVAANQVVANGGRLIGAAGSLKQAAQTIQAISGDLTSIGTSDIQAGSSVMGAASQGAAHPYQRGQSGTGGGAAQSGQGDTGGRAMGGFAGLTPFAHLIDLP